MKELFFDVDEIDTFSQFHQHFMSSSFENIFFPKKLQNQTLIREKLRKTLLYKKVSSKMLMKFTPGVTITIVDSIV